MPQGVHEGDGAAGADNAHGVVQVLRCFIQVAVEDNHVVAARRHTGQHVKGAPGDEARAVGGQAGGCEVAARVAQ